MVKRRVNPGDLVEFDFSEAGLDGLAYRGRTHFIDQETIQVDLCMAWLYTYSQTGFSMKLNDPELAQYIADLFARAADHLRRLNA